MNKTQSKKESPEILPASVFKTLEWNDLIPEEDLNVLMNPPSYIDDLDDSAFDDDIDDQLDDILNSEVYIRYKEALASKKIIPDLNHKNVRIPGFVVPVEFDEESITEFFFGALLRCLYSLAATATEPNYICTCTQRASARCSV